MFNFCVIFFVVLDYDEMNYTIVSGIYIYIYIMKCRFWLYAITMNMMCE